MAERNTCVTTLFYAWVLVLILYVGIVLADNGCQLYEETDQEDNSGPAFAEIISEEVFVFNHFSRELTCASNNFCSIRWFFNGAPYDEWRFGEGGSITDYTLTDNNQTLLFRKAGCDANGTYTCEVSDGRRTISRDVIMEVQDATWNSKPLHYSTAGCRNHTARLGGNASFSCQFAYQYASNFIIADWRKYNESTGGYMLVDVYKFNDTKVMAHEITEKNTLNLSCTSSQTNYDTLTTWINITNVTEAGLGDYEVTCRIFQHETKVILSLSLETPEPTVEHTDVTSTVLTAMFLVAVFLLSLVAWRRFGTEVKLMYHVYFNKEETEESDEMLYDAYVISSSDNRDRAFVDTVLVSSIGDRYRLFIRERDVLPGTTTSEEITTALTKSRRCIVVLSPEFFASHSTSSLTSSSASKSDDAWHEFEIKQALHTMRTHHDHVIPLVYRGLDIDIDVDPNNETYMDATRHLLKYLTELRCIQWSQTSETTLDAWALKRLRLRLPPRRHKHCSSDPQSSSSHISTSDSSSANVSIPDRSGTGTISSSPPPSSLSSSPSLLSSPTSAAVSTATARAHLPNATAIFTITQPITLSPNQPASPTQVFDLDTNANSFSWLGLVDLRNKLSPKKRKRPPYLIDNESLPDGYEAQFQF